MINLLTGDIPTSYKYLLDLVHYSKGEVKVEAQELSEQIKMRMEMGVTEIPDELIQKAEIIVHQVNIGSDNKMKPGKIIQNNSREIAETKVRGSLPEHVHYVVQIWYGDKLQKPVNCIKAVPTLRWLPVSGKKLLIQCVQSFFVFLRYT